MFSFIKIRGAVLSLIIFLLSASTLSATTYNLTVECNIKKCTLNKFWQDCVGSTHMGMVNYSHYHEKDSPIPLNLRKAYKIAADELGFKRVRGHGILCDDVGIYNEDPNGIPYYVWDKYDEIMDFIVYECGMSPVVELSFMPTELSANPSDKVFWYEGCNGPPKDWNRWKDLIYAVVKHSIQRYGKKKVAKWYWEVWNEPNIGFWAGDPKLDTYLKLYDYAVEGAIEAATEFDDANVIKIGGPAVDGGKGDNPNASIPWIKAFITHCQDETNWATGEIGASVDFISYHLYPDNEGAVGDGSYYAKRHNEVLEAIENLDLKNSVSSGDFEYLITETGTSFHVFGGSINAKLSHDTAQSASFAVQAIHNILDTGKIPLPKVWSYWVISDIWEEAFQEPGDKLAFYGIMGMLLRKENIYKPVYHAFKMLNMLGDDRISLIGGSARDDYKGVNGIATMSVDASQIMVIIYNQDYYNGWDHPDESVSDTVNIKIKNIPFTSGKAHVQLFGVDKYKSNTHSIWSDGGNYPDCPTGELWDKMRDGQYIEYVKIPKEVILANATFSDSFTAYHCGVYLYVLTDPDSSPKCDLVVTDITWLPANPDPDDEVKFNAVVLNKGKIGNTYGTPLCVNFSVDGVSIATSSDYTESIPPGAKAIITASTTWSAVEGSRYINAIADFNDNISEDNENNNEYNKSLYVGGPLPKGWNNIDIGDVGAGGSAGYDNGEFTVVGSGEGIWDKKDEFQFVYKEAYGDCNITTKVICQEDSDSLVWSKAGVMIRESYTENSKFANVVLIPTTPETDCNVSFQWRSFNTGDCSASTISVKKGHICLRLVREMDVTGVDIFKGFYSTDGNSWEQIGTSQEIEMDGYIRAGLCVSSHKDGILNTATFTDVNVYFPYFPGDGDGLYARYYNDIDCTDLKEERVDSEVNFNWGTGSSDWTIGPDTFCVEWSGLVTPHFSENYTFYTKTDDGVELWVNNQLIIYKWVDQQPTEWDGNIALFADTNYPIKMKYYEKTNWAEASLSWSSHSQPKEIIPKSQLKSLKPDLKIIGIKWWPQSPVPGDNVTFTATVKNEGTGPSPPKVHCVKFFINGDEIAISDNHSSSIGVNETADITSTSPYKAYAGTFNLGAEVNYDNSIFESDKNNNTTNCLFFCGPNLDAMHGLYGEYFNNRDLTDLVLTCADLNLDFNCGDESPVSEIDANTFSVRWTGFVKPLYAEAYTFYTKTDDGVRLWVNDMLLIDKWINQEGKEYSGTIDLISDKKYYIRMEYYQDTNSAEASLSWSSASQIKEIIPKSQLYNNINEAEDGSWGGGASNYGCYIGDMHNPGSWSMVSNVNALSGGNMIISIKYATYASSVKKSLYVNDMDVKQVTFTNTGGWETFKTLRTLINLNPGTTYRIKLQTDPNEDDLDGLNIDHYTVTSAHPNIYQAETGTWGGGAESFGAYIGSMHQPGAYSKVNFIDGYFGGDITLTIKYATNVTPCKKSLYVNSNNIGQISFPSTGGWEKFSEYQVLVNLYQGISNTIKLQNNDNSGDIEGANIDSYTIEETLALGKNVFVSSSEKEEYTGNNAVDGNLDTRWSSKFNDDEWIYVDLGRTYNIKRIVLYWETAYGKEYKIQVSDDANTWIDILHVTNANGGIDDLTVLGMGRYVRMLGIDRGENGWGYSLYEFRIYQEEVCDGIDNDKDGLVDEGLPFNIYYFDADRDGYGNPNCHLISCYQPNSYVLDNTDCLDNDPNIYPSASELTDGLDNDCDGEIDEKLTKIHLSEGWNLISFQINKCFYDQNKPNLSLFYPNQIDKICFEKKESLLNWLRNAQNSPIRDEADSNKAGDWQSIISFDEEGFHILVVNQPTFVNTLHYISFGYGYWIEMNEPGIFIIQGQSASPDISLYLKDSLNLIGMPYSYIGYTSFDLLTHIGSPDEIGSIVRYNSKRGVFENTVYFFGHPSGTKFNIININSEAYMIFMKTEKQINAP